MHKALSDDSNEDMIVEVTINNKKRQIPVDSDEVKLRRTWTADNRDEFSLNDKGLTLNQLNNLLDVAGINRSNPYNIV